MVYIVIITYNGIKYLERCLKSCYNYNVLVVDNASNDNTVEWIRKNYRAIELIELKENIGYGQANNLGISTALKKGADYIFLLNQDAYLVNDSLDKLLEKHKQHPDFGILSPIHLNGKGDRLDENFSYYMNFRANPDFYSDFVLKKVKKSIYEVPLVNAAGWLIPKKCFQTVGGFDPIFFHYGEDNNFCQRVIYHGLKVGVIPDAHLLHDRESRKMKIKENDDYIEKNLMVKYSDINRDFKDELRVLIRKRKNDWIKSSLKFNFKGAQIYKQEYKMLKRIRRAVAISRRINIKPGSSYLSI